MDECALDRHNCHNDATCVNVEGTYTCECQAGYDGDGITCSDIDECNSGDDTCDEHATCTNTLGSYMCRCNIGYSGDGLACSDLDECAIPSHNCHQKAECRNTGGSYNCVCQPGYSGDGVDCADIDECLDGSHICDGHATCSNTEGTYLCQCNAGYSGDGSICSDIDECSEGIDNCHADATCTNDAGSFVCECDTGYEGDGITCTDITSCQGGPDRCHASGACINTPEGLRCRCNEGFMGNGLSCTDVNECDLGISDCNENAACTNTEGSYDCECHTGYTGNGIVCQDEDECDTGSHDCNDLQECENTIGSFICSCILGYSWNGQDCIDVDECQTSAHTCTDIQSCSNTPGSYLCPCLPGYDEDGQECVDVDECQTDTHDCNDVQVCANAPGSFSCPCIDSYVWDGQECMDKDECALNTFNCDSDSSCVNSPGSYSCECNYGYSGDGKNCERIFCDIPEVEHTTRNGSTNIPVGGIVRYQCDEYYTTADAEGDVSFDVECRDENKTGVLEPMNTCRNSSCSAAGLPTFINVKESIPPLRSFRIFEGITVECIDGYGFYDRRRLHTSLSIYCHHYGIFNTAWEFRTDFKCEDINECRLDRHECHADADCTDNIGSYSCQCKNGHDGDGFSCDDIDECEGQSHSCHELSVCINSHGSYRCQCNPGYTGDGTQCTDIDECQDGSHNCHKDISLCSNTVGSFTCKCKEGYGGDGLHCTDIDECEIAALNNCHEKASCINVVGFYDCVCQSGFYGDGFECEDVNECNGFNSCGRKERCVNTVGGHICECKEPYTRSSNNRMCGQILAITNTFKIMGEYDEEKAPAIKAAFGTKVLAALAGMFLSDPRIEVKPGSIIVAIEAMMIDTDVSSGLVILGEALTKTPVAGYEVLPESIKAFAPDTCLPGEEYVRDKCIACKIGFYKDNSLNVSCQACGEKKITSSTGAISEDSCYPICDAGMYTSFEHLPRGECRPCPVNTYSDKKGTMNSCTPCSPNRFTKRRAASSIHDCVDICQAKPETCANGGKCVYNTELEEATCVCVAGFKGPSCEDEVTTVLSVFPAHGPASGGTLINIRGVHLDKTSTPSVYLGLVFCPLVTNSDSRITCKTPGIFLEQIHNKTFGLHIKWEALGVQIKLEQSFTYLPDPEIIDMYPLRSIISGGISLTVKGENLGSVAETLIELTVSAEDLGFLRSFTDECEVIYSSKMICKTPALNLPGRVREIIEKNEMNLFTSKRRKRRSDVPEVFVTMGLKMDGMPFKNISQQRKLTFHVFGDPQVTPFEDQLTYRPFWPYEDNYIEIVGTRLNVSSMRDIEVKVGSAPCEMTSAFYDKILCRPPNKRPERHSQNTISDEFIYLVSVKYGKHLNFSAGPLRLEEHVLESMTGKIGVGMLAFLLILILCIGFTVGKWWYRRKSKPSLYRSRPLGLFPRPPEVPVPSASSSYSLHPNSDSPPASVYRMARRADLRRGIRSSDESYSGSSVFYEDSVYGH